MNVPCTTEYPPVASGVPKSGARGTRRGCMDELAKKKVAQYVVVVGDGKVAVLYGGFVVVHPPVGKGPGGVRK
jgi:hypothetical protein